MLKYILTGIAIILAIIAIYLIGVYNYGNNSLKGIKYAYEQNQNLYSSFTNKVMESVQIPKMYKKDLQEIIEASMTGRYGEEGLKAKIVLITEDNHKLSTELYSTIQRTIEAGRDDFEKSQKMLLDRKRSFETMIDSVPKGIFLKIFGFTKEKLEPYAIVINTKTKEVFDSKIDEPLKLE